MGWRIGRLKNISWRLVVILAVIVTAVIYVLPTFKPGILHDKQINLGLDLQGGMHLVLEVDTDKAVEGRIERLAQAAECHGLTSCTRSINSRARSYCSASI